MEPDVITMRKGRLRIELDATQVIPENPGEGTPAMVFIESYSSTFFCALDMGEIDGDKGPLQLTDAELKWLESKWYEVDSFIENQTFLLRASQ